MSDDDLEAVPAPATLSMTLRVPIGELSRKAGSRRPYTFAAILAAPSVAEVQVDPQRPVRGHLVVESTLDGQMVLDGHLEAPWVSQCRRCLDPVEGHVVIDVHEIYETRPTVGETYPILGDDIDLGEMVIDAVLLSLPLSPLCGPECPGPDPERFPTTVEADPDPPEENEPEAPAGDPRWSALSELRFDQ